MFLASHMLLRGYGATEARLSPDQKVGRSNLSVLTIALAATPSPAQTEDD